MKTNKRIALLVIAGAVAAFGLISPLPLPAQTARWNVQVARVDPGSTTLPPSFQVAIFEDIVAQLTKSKQFNHVLRDGDPNVSEPANVLLLKTTCERYIPGSEIRRAVTTITGATKLTVRTQLLTKDGNIVLERSIKGNVRFLGSNLRATHNLAHNIAKTMKKSSLPQPLPVSAKATRSGLSDDVVVVEFQ